MANHEIPRTATRIERLFGVDAEGNVVVCSVYQHTRQGHTLPMYFVVQYRERNRRIDRSSRVTAQFSGPDAAVRLSGELRETRAALAVSRVRASHAR
jgi:hypothetical protein